MQNLSKDIITDMVDVARGRLDKLLVSDLSATVTATEADEMVAYLWQLLGQQPLNTHDIINNDEEPVSMRQLIRVLFSEIGVEIEFSGKDKHEKAVVIDADTDLSLRLGLVSSGLMPGQTLIRIGTGIQ